MKTSILWFAIIILFGCEHPESQNFQRNQGHQNTYPAESNYNSQTQDYQAQVEEPPIEKNENVLKMEIENGVRYVWVEINGIRLRFIFDTGASSICISSSEASVLYRQGTLRKEDIIDVQYFQDATGTISEGTRVNLRNVKIANMILENVDAIVVDNVDAPLLLGQSVLERFGSIEINNDLQEIRFK